MSRAQWADLGQRALKTFLQAWIAVFGVAVGGGVVTPEAAVALPWLTATITAAIATLLSVAMSLGGTGSVETRIGPYRATYRGEIPDTDR